ncbi:hypothetical protein AAC387_Pa05g2825 [Persea americana]
MWISKWSSCHCNQSEAQRWKASGLQRERVPKEKAKYKIIVAHGIADSKEFIIPVSQELADQLEIGPRFYVIGISMGAYAAWSCLKHIPTQISRSSTRRSIHQLMVAFFASQSM